MESVREFGGVYLDLDVYVLKGMCRSNHCEVERPYILNIRSSSQQTGMISTITRL